VKTQITATRTAIGEYVLDFAYDQRIINAIKSRVPASKRSYDPIRKKWFIATEDAVSQFKWGVNAWAEVTIR
jgi:hypothetical protein